jgi:uncharacterized Zn finger protein (UPF0148 family)
MTMSTICPKCGGTLRSSYGEILCITCGATPRAKEERRLFYQANKSLMIKDLETMTNDAVVKKRGIPRQVLSHLKSDHLKKRRKVASSPVKTEDPPPARHDGQSWTITWSDLAALDDEDFGDAWRVIGEIERKRHKKGV